MFPTTYAFLFNSSNSLAVWISLVFWLVLYDPVRVGERTWQNHYEHTLNSVVVVIDFFLERRKVIMADYWMVSLKIQQPFLFIMRVTSSVLIHHVFSPSAWACPTDSSSCLYLTSWNGRMSWVNRGSIPSSAGGRSLGNPWWCPQASPPHLSASMGSSLPFPAHYHSSLSRRSKALNSRVHVVKIQHWNPCDNWRLVWKAHIFIFSRRFVANFWCNTV